MRRRMLMGSGKELPKGYSRLEYIQSTGTQYIKTDVIPQKTLTFKTIVEVLTTKNTVIWGVRPAGTFYNAKRQMYLNKTDGTTFKNDIVFFNGSYPNVNIVTEYAQMMNATMLGVKYELLCGQTNAELYTDGATEPMYIFALNNVGKPSAYINCKLYEFIVYDSGSVYRRYIPVQRDADGEIGLFETVTKTFLTNAGTGKFIGG